MAGSLNKVSLIGNLGKDPEIRSTSDGKEIASFSIATTEAWKDKISGERKEKTEWHRIVAWGPTAEIIEKLVNKGKKLPLKVSSLPEVTTIKRETNGISPKSLLVI